MRLALLLAPLLLAGCMEPGPPQPAGAGPLPPSLLVDRTANGTLQLYLHAKHGNVRYAHVNLTLFDGQPDAPGAGERRAFQAVYAVDLDLGRPHANLSVEVVEADVRYAWRATFDLNETGRAPALDVAAFDPREELWEPVRTQGLPFEKLLPRAREEAP